ncbi:MAG: hypothetical protein ABI566_09355 [Pseudolysinimonas sp.]
MTTTHIPTGPNKLVIALIAAGSALLLVIVAIAFLVLGRSTAGSGTIAADEPTTVPESSQTPVAPVDEPADATIAQPATQTGGNSGGGNAPAPVDNSLRFTSFNANLQVACDSTGQAEFKAQPQISWTAVNATAVYWTPSSSDATGDNGYQVGASGNQNTMSDSKGPGERYEFPCNHRQTFDTTITIYGANGQKVSKHVTFTDVNWNTGGDDDQD